MKEEEEGEREMKEEEEGEREGEERRRTRATIASDKFSNKNK